LFVLVTYYLKVFTCPFIRSEICVVLLPGAAHMSKIVSPGWGFNTRLHMTDGKFCNSACGLKDSFTFNCGTREITSVIIIAIPLEGDLQRYFVQKLL